MRGRKQAWLLLGVAMLLGSPAWAQDAPLLQAPAGMTDPVPTPVGGSTLQLTGSYQQARNGPNRDLWGGNLQVEVGVLPNADIIFNQSAMRGDAAPFPADPAERVWGGMTEIGLRWLLVEEQGLWPNLAVYGTVSTSYGETSEPSQAASVTGLLSRRLVDGPRPLALYLSAGIEGLVNPQPGERPGRYQFGAGLAHTLAQDTSVALSMTVQQQDRGESDETLIQGGIWHQLSNGGPLLSVNAGAGVNRDSPSFVVGVSAQWFFGTAR